MNMIILAKFFFIMSMTIQSISTLQCYTEEEFDKKNYKLLTFISLFNFLLFIIILTSRTFF